MHHREQALVRGVLLAERRLEDGSDRVGYIGLEPARLFAQVAEQDLGVARDAELPTEPLQLGSQRVGPVAIEERAEREEIGTQTPRRDARLVHAFGVLPGPRDRVGDEQALH